jgi:hypothetical protein
VSPQRLAKFYTHFFASAAFLTLLQYRHGKCATLAMLPDFTQ